MSDMGVFLGEDLRYQQVFYATHAAGATATWQVWAKPRGCSMVYIHAWAGGGGLTGAAAAARGGGGGGGSAAASHFLCPAFLLPDRLFVQVGKGGAGST